MELTPGTLIANRFKLSRKLGEGGMGAVWFAHHVGLDTPCAVKFIHPDVLATPGVKSRFEREARVAAQLRSPHVVQVLDYGIWEGAPYIAMEYLDGEDLGHRLARQRRLSPRETVAIIGQIARALTKAHAAGLVHRDLKPENVFIVHDDDAELVKVLDFGIAKSQVPTLDANTRTGAILGTPHYMSPEQAQGTKTVDHRADLWSLGVIAYRAAVGALPFQSDALGDLLMRIIVHPLPVPSQVAPDLPATFDAWWTRAAARDPAGRFQTAKELAESLAAALGLSASLGSVALPMSGPTPAPAAASGPSGAAPFAAVTPAPPVSPPMHLATPMQLAPGPAWPTPQPQVGAHAIDRPPTPGASTTPGFAAPSQPPARLQSHPGPTHAMPPHAVPGASGDYAGMVPQETISPASHTFAEGPRAPRSGGALPKVVAAAVALVVGAGLAIGAVKLMNRSGAAVAPATNDTAVPSSAPSVAPRPAPPEPTQAGPSVEPAPTSASPSASPIETAAPNGLVKPPPHPIARPRPPSPPAPPPPPTRTGRVVIPTP